MKWKPTQNIKINEGKLLCSKYKLLTLLKLPWMAYAGDWLRNLITADYALDIVPFDQVWLVDDDL